MENRERGIGWPLGLGSMYMRLRLVDSLQVGAAAAADARSSSFYFQSSRFSSFSSSNLDTESSTSFFQDNSKSLGRLIGVRPCNRRSELHSRNTVGNRSEAPLTLPTTNSSKHHDEWDMEMCDGICIPLCLVAKMSKNKDGSKR